MPPTARTATGSSARRLAWLRSLEQCRDRRRAPGSPRRADAELLAADAPPAPAIAGSADPPPSAPSSGPIERLGPWDYVTTERLVRDATRLIPMLPQADHPAGPIDAVAGIARSGLLPASLLSFHLHLPLLCVSRFRGVTDPGHGLRLEGTGPCRSCRPRHVLLIDDTAAHGREMSACTPIVRAAFPGAHVTRAVVYSAPAGLHAVDLVVGEYPGLHFLEWNWPNAGHGVDCVFDFDGILCEDCPPGDDDDGPRYASFLRDAAPKFLPRRLPIHTVVTARHRKYEPQTRAWLARHGVATRDLVMRDWEWAPGEWSSGRVARFKAGHYLRSGTGLFAESCPVQAAIINEATGLPVICPAAGKVFPPRGEGGPS